jgi:hypothetical protein
MGRLATAILAVALLLTSVAPGAAQSTTGTISGRVVDAQSLPVPGVAVTVESLSLQGTRTPITSANGDYIRFAYTTPRLFRISFGVRF